MQTLLPLALIPDAFLAPVAIGFTVAAAGCILYWMLMAIGLLDDDAYDGSSESVAGVMLHFVFGHAPPLLVFSLATLVGWVVAVAAIPAVEDWAPWQQVLLDLPILAGGLVVGRLMSFPISRMYKKNREDDAKEQSWTPIGMLGRVVSHEVTETHGQIEVNKGGPTVLLSARCEPGQKFTKGEVIKIISRDGGSGYLIDKPDSH